MTRRAKPDPVLVWVLAPSPCCGSPSWAPPAASWWSACGRGGSVHSAAPTMSMLDSRKQQPRNPERPGLLRCRSQRADDDSVGVNRICDLRGCQHSSGTGTHPWVIRTRQPHFRAGNRA